MSDPVIYLVTNIVTGKMYIGQTRRGLPHRKAGHLTRLRLGERDHKLYESMRKHGVENFTFEVLYRCRDEAELDAMEIFFIGAANSFRRGYNMTCGGDHVSDETREKLRRINTGRKVTWIDKAWASRKANILAGRTKPQESRRGASHPRAKKYAIRLPDGTEQTIVGLNQFCTDHGLTKQCLLGTLSGAQRHHKNFALLARLND